MAARGITAPVFSSHSKGALDQAGHNHDALGFVQQLLGNPFIWSCHDFLKGGGRMSKRNNAPLQLIAANPKSQATVMANTRANSGRS